MFSSDNFPTHSITYRAELPSTTLTTDLVHLEKRLTGTLRQCAATALTNPVPSTPLHPKPLHYTLHYASHYTPQNPFLPL